MSGLSAVGVGLPAVGVGLPAVGVGFPAVGVGLSAMCAGFSVGVGFSAVRAGFLPWAEQSLRTILLSREKRCFDDFGEAAEEVLEPGGVMVIVRRGRVGAAHFRGDAAGAEEAEAAGDVMHPKLEGQAALRPAAQRAGDALAGSSGHFRRKGEGELPLCAGAGVGLAIIKTKDARPCQRKRQCDAAAQGGNGNVILQVLFRFLPNGRFYRHINLHRRCGLFELRTLLNQIIGHSLRSMAAVLPVLIPDLTDGLLIAVLEDKALDDLVQVLKLVFIQLYADLWENRLTPESVLNPDLIIHIHIKINVRIEHRALKHKGEIKNHAGKVRDHDV